MGAGAGATGARLLGQHGATAAGGIGTGAAGGRSDRRRSEEPTGATATDGAAARATAGIGRGR